MQMGGGSLNLEILSGGGLKQFWKSMWTGGVGSKNRAFRRGGVDFFWNNPLGLKGLIIQYFMSLTCIG